MRKEESWKINFETFGNKTTKGEQVPIMNHFIPSVDVGGKVKMKNPDVEYNLVMEYEVTVEGEPRYPRTDNEGRVVEGNKGKGLRAVYFSKLVSPGGRSHSDTYKLTNRLYLGPTSMDNEISMLMCLSSLITPSSYVCDPFVGTGSILFTASVMGATTVGMDIDVRVLKGRKKGVDVIDGGREVGTRENHIVRTKVYEVSDVMSDLLTMAARNLRMGGRLVYLIPTLRDFDEKVDLPSHECLKLEWCCNQPLQLQLGRRMVVMTKVKEWKEEMMEVWRERCWPMGEESANKVERLREQMGKEAERKRKVLEEEKGVKEGNKTSKKAKRKIWGVERNTVEVKKWEDDVEGGGG
ncbi:hypothetical protein TrRE_jg1278 [Triparma retinervis]|uniref:tRNA (guanine(10)-N(2))-methyltransferase TRMT11 N-terminal domain-containing protein n=1 Tax=Triparma retinervis TaxID=2557542 RepID=A0A9W7AFE7_9STRA|nr:hypothetical protein TrRE_jg1278 [Triparma retinervis]